MDRYKAETLGGVARVGGAGDTCIGNVGKDEACFSCRATAGTVSGRGEPEGTGPSS